MLIVPLVLVWILAVIFLKKLNMHFFVFLIGSVGLFCFLMYIFTGYLEKYLAYGVTYCMGVIGKATGLFSAYSEYSMVMVQHRHQAVTFFVDYECSGLIEMLVYICLLVFYPIYRCKEKARLLVFGIVFIFVANVIRVFTICVIIRAFGNNMFFFSHTVFARILFFAFMLGLYYVVFTRPHILKQKVGDLTYGE